jgi:hypothetical protein
MRGATCAIFMTAYTFRDEYQRVRCSKVPLEADQSGFG